MNKFRDLQAAFLAKSFVTTAILFSLFAFSGHFATAEAQSGSWRLKDIQVFTKMGGYSQITSEKYDKTGGNVEINSSGNALDLCPGGSEKMRFTWNFVGDMSTISNGGAVPVNLSAGVLSTGKPCRLGSIGDFSVLSIYGGSGGSSPFSADVNKQIDSDRFHRNDNQYYVNASGGPASSTTSLGINAGPNLSQYPLAYFDLTVGTRAGDIIRYVYIYESAGSGSGGGDTGVVDMSVEYDTDRMYGDYTNYDLPRADFELCRSACASDAKCLAYTYVKPGVQSSNARCWLKSSVKEGRGSSCCISGVKSHGSERN